MGSTSKEMLPQGYNANSQRRRRVARGLRLSYK